MDKELYDLKNWAIKTLKEYKAELLIRQQVTGRKPSELKKLDRFLNLKREIYPCINLISELNVTSCRQMKKP